MTSRDFCYWLQGYFELLPNELPASLTPYQVDTVRKHLSLVFLHEIDPSVGPPEHQAALNAVHSASPSFKFSDGGGPYEHSPHQLFDPPTPPTEPPPPKDKPVHRR